MGKKDPRIDAYISKSREFARPILNHIRELVHKGCLETEETIKWGFPHFDYKGIMCGMGSFKSHCTFGFWKGNLLKGMSGGLGKIGETAMGQFGRITSLKDLPKDSIIIELVRQAKKINEDGIKQEKPLKTKVTNKVLDIPEYFMAALKKNKKALATFVNFSFTNKREYVEWVSGAKTEETRNSRITTSIEWISEGKIRNWKYVKK